MSDMNEIFQSKEFVDAVINICNQYGYNKIKYTNPASFKKGDWVVDYHRGEELLHLWTIQDAHDGDILVNSSGEPFIYREIVLNDLEYCAAYCGVDIMGKFVPIDNFTFDKWTAIKGCHPATKPQIDVFMKTIENAGYAWFADEKKLRKLTSRAISWRDNANEDVSGWLLDGDEFVVKLYGKNTRSNYSLFAVYLQAKAAQAMARISQIMKNDKRFGGVMTVYYKLHNSCFPH